MNAEEFRKLYDMVDRKNFYLYFDSQNYFLNRGYRETDILEGLYPLMCNQLHVKDGSNGAMSGGLLGTGDSGFFETMDWLNRHGLHRLYSAGELLRPAAAAHAGGKSV